MRRTTALHPRLITLGASLLVIAALYLAKGVLIPFALAMLVSFLLAPLVLRLQRWHFSRLAAVVTAVLLVFVATCATSWIVFGELRDLTTSRTEYKRNIHDKVEALRGVLSTPVQQAMDAVEGLGDDLAPAATPENSAIQTVRIAEGVRGPMEVLRDTLGPMLDVLTTAAMALLFAVVMLLRRADLGDRFIRLMGPGKIVVTTRALEEAARKVSSYLWHFLLLNVMHGVAVGIGLALIGVPHALLWGLLSAGLRFIPYLGPWIAAALPFLTALAVFPGWSQPLFTLGLFALLELISNNLLEPWLYGVGTGLSPLAVLVSALFWTWLWGPVGLVLSTPLTVCLVVLGKHMPQLRFLQQIFGDAPGLSPPARLYQRLLAGDQDQAWLVLRTEMQQKSLHEAYDAVVLPALSMAEQDKQRGVLDEEGELRLEETMHLLLEEAAEPLSIGAVASSVPEPVSARADTLRVLCLPARGRFDALAGEMLRQVLERAGLQAEIASSAELTGPALERFESRGVDVVCISAVPPSRFMHVRALCKRIASRWPRLPIVAGMWTLELEAPDLAERLPILAGVHVVTSLADARAYLGELAEAARRERGPQPPVSLPATG